MTHQPNTNPDSGPEDLTTSGGPTLDLDALEEVLIEQVGENGVPDIFAEWDRVTALRKLDTALDCRCIDREDEEDRPDVATCGACGRSWCQRCHPAPSARCPFEYDHTPEPEQAPERLVWEAGARRGKISASGEGTVTLLLDDEPFLGVDLAAGKVLIWPDGETNHEIATFTSGQPHRSAPATPQRRGCYGLSDAEVDTLVRLAAATADEHELRIGQPDSAYLRALSSFNDPERVHDLAVRVWGVIARE